MSMPKSTPPRHKRQSAAPKHLAELDPTKRAIADQSIRNAMLAIVVAQGKPVTIPIADLNDIAENHRLILAVDHQAGLVTLTAEKFKPTIIMKGTSIGKTDVGLQMVSEVPADLKLVN
jgi:hypothetical protein